MDPINDVHFIAALMLVQHIDEGITTGRKHYRTKRGRFLPTLNDVVLAITEDNLMLEQLEQVGILYENTLGLSITDAIGLAVTRFLQADHCGQAHRTPEEARVNPDELNGTARDNLYGLQLIADKSIPAGRIRICTRGGEQQ